MRYVFACLLYSVALAATAAADDTEVCASGESKERIGACTAVIRAKARTTNVGGAYNNRGVALLETGRPVRAILDFDEAVKLLPRDAGPLINRGAARCSNRQYRLGVGDVSKAISLSTASRDAYFNRALCHYLSGDLRRALGDIGEVLKSDNKDTGAYFVRSLAYQRAGDDRSALIARAVALRLDRNIAEANAAKFRTVLLGPEFKKRARSKRPGSCGAYAFYSKKTRKCEDARLKGGRGRAAEVEVEYNVVDVFYGTDRKKTSSEPRVTYGSEQQGSLTLGKSSVTVPLPEARKIGEIPRPWWVTTRIIDILGRQEDPKKYFTIQKIEEMDQATFKARINAKLEEEGEFKKQALVFVHGYNVSFDDALYRMAQIVTDLGFDGAPLVYSWPSAGELIPYKDDRKRAEGAVAHLREYLEFIARELSADKIHLVGHSMGSVPLMRALETMKQSPQPSYSRINEIIFAAPDVGLDEFRGLAASVVGFGKGKTLYASSKDRALWASMNVWSDDRAGYVPSGGPLVVEGMETIDVSAINTDFLGHSTYAARGELLNDLMLLFLRGQHPPRERQPFFRVKAPPADKYWYWPE